MKYKDICAQFNLPVVSGKQKQLQLEDLKRYCNYIKDGTNFTILEIYDEPLPKIDSRMTTLPYVEFILLNVLSKSDVDGIYYASTKDLLRICYIINNNYASILNDKTHNAIYICNKYDFDDTFLDYVDKLYDVIKPTVVNALRSMENKKEIILGTGYKLKKDNTVVRCVSQNSELGQEIFKIQGEGLMELGIEKYSDLFGKAIYKKQDFFDFCDYTTKYKSKNDPLWIKNKWNFDGFFQCYEIILNTDKIIYDLKRLVSTRQQLNEVIKNKIHISKTLQKIDYDLIEQWFLICNTAIGDEEYPIVEDIKKIIKTT